MRTTRRTGVVWTLAAAALASLATVPALPGGSGAVTRAVPDNTQRAAGQRIAAVGSTLTATQGSWTEPDELLLPVGPLPAGRRPAGRRRLRRDRRRHDDELRRRGRRRRSPPSRPRHRVERRRLARPSPPTLRPRPRGRPGPARQRPGADALGHGRAGPDAARQPGTWNGRQPITYTFRWLRCDTVGNNCIVQQGFQDDAYARPRGRRRQDDPRPRDRAERAGEAARSRLRAPSCRARRRLRARPG